MSRVAPLALVALLVCSPALAQSLEQASPPASPAASVDRLSFSALMRDLGRDFRALPSLDAGAILGVSGGLAVWVRSEDAEITQQWSVSEGLDRFFEPGDVLGSSWVQVGGAVATYVLGRGLDKPRTAQVGAALIRSQTINAVFTQGIKLAVRRQRPDGRNFSFPSGHASATFATAAVLQRHYGWRVGAPAYAVAAFVGGSRLQENRHYLSDVLFGAAIGIVSGRTVTIGRGEATFSMAPLLAPGTAGVLLTHRAHR